MTPENKTVYGIQMDKATRDEWKTFAEKHSISLATIIHMAMAYLMEEEAKGNITVSKIGIKEVSK